MSYLVDTDWIIDGLAGGPVVLQTLDRLASDGLAVSLVTVGEVFEGAYRSSDPAARLRSYRRFLSGYQILPPTESIMERFAWLRATLRSQGALIPDFDLLIAATALDYSLTLVSRNQRHFNRIPGLELYQPQ